MSTSSSVHAMRAPTAGHSHLTSPLFTKLYLPYNRRTSSQGMLAEYSFPLKPRSDL